MELENKIDSFIRISGGIKCPINQIEDKVKKFCEENDCIDRKDEIVKKMVDALYSNDEPIKLI